MIQLENAIRACGADDSVKVILREIVAALNTLNTARTSVRGDIVIKDESSGVVFRGTDGNYYRQKIDVEGGTVTAIYINLGPKEPAQ
jgi:hypothetical protein